MIRHCVFLSLRPDYDPNALTEVLAHLKALTEKLNGTHGFVGGPNRDFEAKSAAFPAGFTIDFDTEADLARYADDPTHRALGARLCDLCIGGADGIVVYDLVVAP